MAGLAQAKNEVYRQPECAVTPTTPLHPPPTHLSIINAIEHAAIAANEGRVDVAASELRNSLPRTDDLRLLFLGFQFFFRVGDLDEAARITRRRIEIAQRSVVVAESCESRPASDANDSHDLHDAKADLARALANLGLIHHTRGEYDDAASVVRRALEIDRGINNLKGVARDLGTLAMIPESRSDLDAAEAMYLEALEIAERIGAADIAATKYANLGDIALRRNQPSRARELWAEAERLFARLGNEKYRAECHRKLSELKLQ